MPNRPASLADYLAIVWRRKWVMLAVPTIAGAVAFVMTDGAPSYRAEALVLLNRSNVVTGVTDTQDPSVTDSTRFLTTQANVARSPGLASRVAAEADILGLTPAAARGAISVKPQVDADMLKFSVSWQDPGQAVLIANTFAKEYTRFKAELDAARINSALLEIRTRMRSLAERGQADSPAYETLAQYQSQLIIGRLLTGNSASVLEPAEVAREIRANPLRNFAAGGLLGIVLAFGLVFLAEALDRRVRTEEELETVLDIPLLGRVSRPPHELRMQNQLVMLAEPLGSHAETFRRLRASIEFVNLQLKARTIMFTSAVPREGKSTTAANVAVALARTGRRVALVDLDVRKPLLPSLFRVPFGPGMAEIVVDDVPLEQALQRIALPASSAYSPTADDGQPLAPARPRWSPAGVDRSIAALHGSSNSRADTQYVLQLLTCGRVPSGNAEFLESERVAEVLEELGEAFDVVLVDAPPLLAVGDAMALSAKVDAIVVVTHWGIRRPLLHELARELQNCRAPKLGFVLTGVPKSDGFGYGYGYGYGHADRDPGQVSDVRSLQQRTEKPASGSM